MKSMYCITIFVAAATFELGSASQVGSRVTPIQKVIQLMEGMLNKGKSEKHEEQLQFAAYRQFCDDTSAEKNHAIDEADEKLAMLKADIQKYTVHAARLTKEIAGIDEDVSTWTGDIKAATAVREIEEADHHEAHKDYTESIEALEGAIHVLERQAHDRKQADSRRKQLAQFQMADHPADTADQQSDSFAQISALKHLRLIPQEAKNFADAFLQATSGGLSFEAPEANAYDFQSSGVIEMLSKLLDKFVAERTALEHEEAESHHAYELLSQELHTQITQGEKDVNAKSETKAQKLQARAEAFGSMQDTVKMQKADEKYLRDLTATCEQKAGEFESRQQLRAEEIQAIEKAIELISSELVAGSADRHLSSMAQTQTVSSFGQLRSSMESQTHTRVLQYLKGKSQKLSSRLLSSLVARIVDDPFTKVRKLIKDLIVRLLQEANEEAEHKGWCDEELATNAQTRREKSAAVETMHADIDELESSTAKLAEELTDLSHELAELDEAMAKATHLRQEEKAHNFATIKDAMDAQQAVEQAIVVLKEFYSKSGDATAFVQQREEPEIFDSPYQGMLPESGGAIGMLDVIESDFARLESETKASEASGQKEYEGFMSDSKVDKAEKQQMVEHKTAAEQDQSQSLQMKKEDLMGTQKELDAALAYFEKLKPSCVDAGVSYEDRVARRREEIESLQEALKILNGEDIA